MQILYRNRKQQFAAGFLIKLLFIEHLLAFAFLGQMNENKLTRRTRTYS